MICPRCNAPVEEGTVFCGNCGNQVAPLNARGVTMSAEATELIPADSYQRNSLNMSYRTQEPQQPMSGPPSLPPFPPNSYQSNFLASTPPASMPPINMPPAAAPAAPLSRLNRGGGPRFAFIATLLVVLIVVVSAGSFALFHIGNNNSSNSGKTQGNNQTANNSGMPATITGSATFSDSQSGLGHTNSARISVAGLQPPAAGTQYYAWLLDTDNESAVLNLGAMRQEGQVYVATPDAHHTNLIGVGNKIEITQEQGNPSIPTGNILLSGTFPPQAFVHVRHLLFSFPTTPNHQGLLVGLLDQTQKLDGDAVLLKNANGNQFLVECVAQSIIDIAEGSGGSHYRPLNQQCAGSNVNEMGDSFGLLGNNGYINTAAAHAALAANSADATPGIKVHAGHVGIATKENLMPWITTIDQDAEALINNPGDTTKIQEIVNLADRSLNGVDLDSDEHVDPVKGEAGAITAYNHGQLMASLTLVAK